MRFRAWLKVETTGLNVDDSDSLRSNFVFINRIITKDHSDEIRQLLLQMFPGAREAIELQYRDEDGAPFAEWRRMIYEIDRWVLEGPFQIDSKHLILDPEDYRQRMDKYKRYVADKEAGRPARYFRNDESDPRDIDFAKLPPITVAKTSGGFEVVDGVHRATLARVAGKPLKAYVWKSATNKHPNVAKIKSLFSRNGSLGIA